MPGLDQGETRDVAVTSEENFDFSEIGAHCRFDWTPEPHYLADGETWVPDEFEDPGDRDLSPLSEGAQAALIELDRIANQADIAPRRIEIEQAWKAIHYDRGYQFLLKHRNGGWTMPSTGFFSASNQNLMGHMYATNVYGEKKEIITAALAREVPRVEFFPANPDHGPDQDMSEVADDLKQIWAKNNSLQCILRDCAGIFYNEDRSLLWTRYELNGDEYGYEDPDEPVVPEDELNPPTTPTGTDRSIQYQEENESPINQDAPRRPRGRVVTTAYGKLDHKVPINVDGVPEMGVVQVFQDVDIAMAKAQFPWMREKIHGGGDGTGETELDRIARENVRQAVPGQYVTGDAINRHTVIKHTYIRRGMFYDASVNDEIREELLAKFPDGAKLVKAATEFCYARNECIDEHITVGHPFPGKGQNRRALGESLIPIQDYINELVSLALDYAKRTVPKKWYDSEAFNIEALKQQNNIPGTAGPVQIPPGRSAENLVFIEPTPTPQPWMIQYIQWAISSLSEQITGAMPSLFGAAITGQVGSEGVAIQRDQAMQRVGCPWNELQKMFACAARQAVMITAKCANKDINDVIPGKGRVSIKLNKLKGNVLCYPESNPEFPESWAQRETRVMQLVDHALNSPNTEFAKMVLDPRNLKAIKSAVRMPDFEIAGAASVEKQNAEMEILLRSGPLPNPMKMKLQRAAQQGDQLIAATQMKLAAGQPVSPQEQQMMQAAPKITQQIQQQMSSLPDLISTVTVRDDGSENYEVEAGVCFDWMNGPNGRKFSNGTPEQKAAFQNVLLHWKETTGIAAKIAAQKAQAAMPPPPPPRVSFSGNIKDLPAPEAAAAVQAGGIPSNVGDFGVHRTQELNRDVAKRVIPDQIYLSGLHKEDSEPAPAPAARKLRR